MKRATKWMLRVLAGSIMVLALGGPAPGNVGGCGSTAAVANPGQHCTDFEFWKCRRDQFAGRINNTQFNDCVARVDDTCSAAAWPAGCYPTPAQSNACVLLLQRTDLANLTNDQLLSTYDECNLCM